MEQILKPQINQKNPKQTKNPNKQKQNTLSSLVSMTVLLDGFGVLPCFYISKLGC